MALENPQHDLKLTSKVYVQLKFLMKKESKMSSISKSASKKKEPSKYEVLLKRLHDVCLAKLILATKDKDSKSNYSKGG